MRDSDRVEAVFTGTVLDEMEALPPNEQIRILKRIALFERKGWSLSAQAEDIERLRGEIWELRVLGTGPAYRVLFFSIPGNPGRIVVLTSCVANSRAKKHAVGDAEIERAERRRQEWLRQQERK
ncbi:MAG TPA: type II toxin-antitoxin system RelE/ParE family toxin [Longimicrobium sp.]|nr:type II toxin-antitoxin system RelE/ParE family toxin [Longimicrobium sp.]